MFSVVPRMMAFTLSTSATLAANGLIATTSTLPNSGARAPSLTASSILRVLSEGACATMRSRRLSMRYLQIADSPHHDIVTLDSRHVVDQPLPLEELGKARSE